MLPETSSTKTMSSGTVVVDTMFDVEESAENETRNSESPRATLMLSPE